MATNHKVKITSIKKGTVSGFTGANIQPTRSQANVHSLGEGQEFKLLQGGRFFPDVKR